MRIVGEIAVGNGITLNIYSHVSSEKQRKAVDIFDHAIDY